MIDRVKTGIPGLDELIGGGIPKESSILLTGVAGTGKTILAMQFLYNGALHFNEPGIYVSMEEEPHRLIRNFSSNFGWDIQELIDKKLLSFITAELYSFEKLRNLIETEISSIKATRIVIDPITILGLYFERTQDVRKCIVELSRSLKDLGCTTLLVSELPEGSKGISTFGAEEFVADGIIILHYLEKPGGSNIAVSIRKMRNTGHDTGFHPVQITQSGAVIFSKEQIPAKRLEH